MIEAHTTLGAEILIQTEGLHPLTPTVALEHHRGVKGTGYPDLGEAIPHPMSQIVSVADIYEAITGARTYQAPTPPERACMIMARMAGEKLNTGLVKKFVNAITFFPVGSLVRTNRNELGLVVQTNRREPLHPVLALVDEETYKPTRPGGHVRARVVRRLRAAHHAESAGTRRARSARCSSSRQRQPDLPLVVAHDRRRILTGDLPKSSQTNGPVRQGTVRRRSTSVPVYVVATGRRAA